MLIGGETTAQTTTQDLPFSHKILRMNMYTSLSNKRFPIVHQTLLVLCNLQSCYLWLPGPSIQHGIPVELD